MKNNRNAAQAFLATSVAAAVMVLVFVPLCRAQTKVQSQTTAQSPPEAAFSEDLKKYPGLLPELGQLTEALKRDVKFPEARRQSTLLPLLPADTTYYVALPNYGEVAQQSLTILDQHLQSSAVLRDWWQHGELSSAGPKMLDFLRKFADVSQYLGDEVVVSGATGGKNRDLLVLAEVRKPGLKQYLNEMWKQTFPDSLPIRVLEPKDLASAAPGPAQQLTVLVRSDYVLVAQNIDALRAFNSVLDAKPQDFAATAFAQRIQHSYQDGVSMLLAADLHTILHGAHIGNKQNEELLERSGFGDMKYVVWEYNHATDKSSSQGELSFTGPRRAVASWLAAPAPMGGLGFVSPKAAMVGSLMLKNFADIYSDMQYLAAASNPQAFAMVTPMEQAMHISLKDDLLALLPGEIAVELEKFAEPQPAWKVVLRVTDAGHLQSTLQKIFTTMQYKTMQFEEDGVTYHSVSLPSPQKGPQIVYAFVDGYLLIAPNHQMLADAIGLHKSGESLAKSATLPQSLPAGYPAEVSALFYEDPAAAARLNLSRVSPDMAEAFARIAPPTVPIIYRAYGEESVIRGVSTSGGADPSMLLIVAAIAIPNLLRARMAANEASAVATMRTIDVAQITYSSAYPEKGYARDLASLGPDARGAGLYSSAHASIIDNELGNSKCTAGAWCPKSGYRFTVVAECESLTAPCKDFVATASPVSDSTGTRNFCSTSDGVVRLKLGAPLNDAVTAAECRRWAPVQ